VKIAILLLTFHIPNSNSLKAKRQVSQSIIARLRGRFNVSIAELGKENSWQILILGLTTISNNGLRAAKVLDSALIFVQSMALDAELVQVEREIV
jgi:uncharacterized protein YlxP (DUF503 family)